jgi:hypothetical protein
MNLVRVEAISWNRFLTKNFAVVPELLGRSHEFQFHQGIVSIELPTRSGGEERVKILSYRQDTGRPTRFWVNSVDVLVRLHRQVNVPEQVLHQPPNAYDVLSQDQQDHLEKTAETHGSLSEKVFDVWLRTLRWKSNNAFIGRPEVRGPESGWTTYLLDETTRHRFWAATQVFRASPGQAVTLAEWEEAGQALKNGIKSPVFYDLMFDAIEHFRLGDLQRSVVDAAVACESFMRGKVMQQLPSGLSNTLRRYIDEANIRQVLTRFYPEILNDDETKNLKAINSILHQLFDARNTILHSGYKGDLTSDECHKYLEATQKLVSIG